MGNFDFLRAEWPQIHESCAKAESYVTNDPSTACILARRSIEVLVMHLYRLLDLPEPYKRDLAAHIADPRFKRITGDGMTTKLMLIKNVGNKAVHSPQPIPAGAALQVMRELYLVMVWAAFRYSASPDAVPMGRQFDPKLAAQAAPLSRADVVKLAEKFREQDEAHARALEERDSLIAELDAEIEKMRAEVRAAQAEKTRSDTQDYREDETRDQFIDLLLNEAGWPLDKQRDREYPVTGMPSATGKGYVDYVLWGSDGLPLAVVEAKRTRRSPLEGQEQARLYADALEREFGRRPIIYYTNGYTHEIWDDASGYPPRAVQGFATAEQLELLVQRRLTRRPLATEPVDPEIAGRYYQVRAISAIGNAFDSKQRHALLVMATGTGKTRTSVALVKQLMNAGWVKNVLFLADRTALVDQAHKAFLAHYPESGPVNLLNDPDKSGRVSFCTYQTMLGLIQKVDGEQRLFGPGHFDLVIIDEAHRSVYAKYGYIFEYFDSLLLGLTATPKDEVDHNTYRLFQLEDGVPTDAYSLDQGITDGYLVPPKGVSVGTTFLRRGIRYSDLSESEKDEWDMMDWGEDGPPDSIEADEINRFLFNEDTVDKVLALLMESGHKVAGGDRLAKTIIFAKNQRHADFIAQRFDAGWPHLAGEFARVITHGVSYASTLIESFENADSAPHIAISVDMLDTGIDVPEVANLVFFKPVRSKTKFWQMIGRGTRLCPGLYGEGEDKKDFYVFDFCGNLEFFSQNLPTVEGSLQKSLTQRIFEHRVALVRGIDMSNGDPDLRRDTARLLHEFVTGMTLDNVLVRPHRRLVEKFSDGNAWDDLSAEDAHDVLTLGGLPSKANVGPEPAKRFDLLILRAQVALLDGDTAGVDRIRETVQAIATDLLGRTSIPLVVARADLLEDVAGDDWWVDVTLPMLELARVRLRDLAGFVVSDGGRNPVYTDFADTLTDAVDIDLPGTTPGMNWDRFRDKTRAYLREHSDHLAIQKLRRNKQLTDTDLGEFEKMLQQLGAERTHIDRAVHESGSLGLFLRSLSGLDRAAAVEAFAQFLDESTHTVEQIRFVDMIVSELTVNGIMEPSRIFESPYTDDFQPVDTLFAETEVESIVTSLRVIRANADPEQKRA